MILEVNSTLPGSDRSRLLSLLSAFRVTSGVSPSQQIPLEQTWPAAQPVPHAPQLLVVFNGVQAPLQQPSPLPQALSHVPQCCKSLARSTQAVPQAVSPAGQERTQLPCEQR